MAKVFRPCVAVEVPAMEQKMAKRVLVVRENGDDVAVPYEVPRFETLADAERFFGADYMLRKLQRAIETEVRSMELHRYRRNHQ